MQLYAGLMEEVKTRLRAISVRMPMLASPNAPPEAYLDAEFCFLQVRMICEIVALGSLAAHYPLGLRKDLIKSYAADRIFTELSNINSRCFPHPIKVNRTEEGIKIVPREGPFLTISELQRMYSDCGAILHRGILKHAITGKPKELNISTLDRWARALGKLLQDHIIYVAEIDLMLVVHLTVLPDNRAQVALARTNPSPQELEALASFHPPREG